MASQQSVGERRHEKVIGTQHEEDVHTAAERGLAATDQYVHDTPPFGTTER